MARHRGAREPSRTKLRPALPLRCYIDVARDGAREVDATQPGSHWDPLVLLFDEARVARGDVVRLEALADYERLQPRYAFRASVTTAATARRRARDDAGALPFEKPSSKRKGRSAAKRRQKKVN